MLPCLHHDHVLQGEIFFEVLMMCSLSSNHVCPSLSDFEIFPFLHYPGVTFVTLTGRVCYTSHVLLHCQILNSNLSVKLFIGT